MQTPIYRRLHFLSDYFINRLVLLNRALRRSKKSFVNGRCVKLSETYVKHFHIYL